MSASGLILFFVVCVALVAAGEEPMTPPEMDPHHHVTTVCIQVHGISSALCGPMVKPEAARGASFQMAPAAEAARSASFQMAPAAEAARGASLQMAPAADAARANQNHLAAQNAHRNAIISGPPNGASLQGFYENVPVYRMSSADENNQHQQSQFFKAAEPCPEPFPRSAGSVVSVVQPGVRGLGYQTPLIGGVGGVTPYGGVISPLGGIAPGSVVTVQQPGSYMRAAGPGLARDQGAGMFGRTAVFAPFGVDQQQQQQMRASQFAAARAQQYATANAAGCDDNLPIPASRMSASNFQAQQQMRQAYPPPSPQVYSSMRDTAQSADFYAKQCAEQEMEIKKKAEEITELKKQVDRLSSMTGKTTIEQKTVSFNSSSSNDSQSDDGKVKAPPQVIKKKK